MTGRVGGIQLTVGAKGWAWLGCRSLKLTQT